MKKLVALWAALLFFGSAHSQLVYLNSRDNLYEVDLTTCKERLIGTMVEVMHDIALAPDGKMYAISDKGILFLINKSTAAATPIGPTGVTCNALVSDKNGMLYGAGDNRIYRINPVNGMATLIGSTGNFYSAGDLSFYNNELFLSANNNQLVKINQQDPLNSELVGHMNGQNLWGIITVGTLTCQGDATKMYATGSDGVYEVNTTTAAVTKICPLSFMEVSGAASPAESSTFLKRTAGKDSTTALCFTQNQPIHLNTLLQGADPNGKWLSISPVASIQGDEFTPDLSKDNRYIFHYVVGDAQCADTARFTITTTTLSAPTLSDTILCGGATWRIDLSGLNAQVTWHDNSTSPIYTISQAGTYSVSLRKQECSSSASFLVSYFSDQDIRKLGDSLICDGKPARLEVAYPSGQYRWFNNSTQPAVAVTQTGTYWVEVTAGRCVSRQVFVVNESVSPKIPLAPTYELCPDKPLILDATESSVRTYHWQDGSTQPSIIITKLGTYSLTVSNECGTLDKQIQVLNDNCLACNVYLPDAFSPNGDTVNDNFSFTTSCDLAQIKLTIYNRWGEIIFQSTEPAIAWNGTYKNNRLEGGIYNYKLTYRFSREDTEFVKSGTVLLIR